MIAVAEKTRHPKHTESTGAQTVLYSFGDGVLKRDYTQLGTYAQLRAVRLDPTVALARGMLISTIQAGAWNIEADDDVSDDVREFIEHILLLREDLLYNALAYGRVDFGWCGFEKIFKVKNNRIVLDALKPLLHDITHILVTKQGHFNGFRQQSVGWGSMTQTNTIANGPTYPVDLKVEKSLLLAFGVEAGNYYGVPLLENIRSVFDDWSDCNDGAKRYDNKIAGAHWVIHYPLGTTTIDGIAVDNGVVAADVLAAMESSGSVAVPSTTATVLQELTNNAVADVYAWKIELISDKGLKQTEFVKKLAYLDTLKVRGLQMPERALLEGTHGTKAEAGEHIGLMFTHMQETDRAITRAINQQVVRQLLRLNFGEELVDKVRLVASPLIDTQLEFLRKLYIEKISDPNINLVALKEKLDVPEEEGGSAIEATPEEVETEIAEDVDETGQDRNTGNST